MHPPRFHPDCKLQFSFQYFGNHAKISTSDSRKADSRKADSRKGLTSIWPINLTYRLESFSSLPTSDTYMRHETFMSYPAMPLGGKERGRRVGAAG